MLAAFLSFALLITSALAQLDQAPARQSKRQSINLLTCVGATVGIQRVLGIDACLCLSLDLFGNPPADSSACASCGPNGAPSCSSSDLLSPSCGCVCGADAAYNSVRPAFFGLICRAYLFTGHPTMCLRRRLRECRRNVQARLSRQLVRLLPCLLHTSLITHHQVARRCWQLCLLLWSRALQQCLRQRLPGQLVRPAFAVWPLTHSDAQHS